jgi:hypothetical protein
MWRRACGLRKSAHNVPTLQSLRAFPILFCRTLFRKKTLQQRSTFFQPNAGRDLATMVQRGEL